MSRKLITVVITFLMCFGFKAFAEDTPNFIWEDFTTGIPEGVVLTNAEIAGANGGVEDNNSALITVKSNSGNAYFPIKLESDKTYDFSVWLKMKDALPLKNLANPSQGYANTITFVIRAPKLSADGVETSEYVEDKIVLSGISYSTDEYVKYSTAYEYTGNIKSAECGENAYVYIVVANGYRQQQGSTYATMDYYIDDLRVVPQYDENECISNVSVSNVFVDNELSLEYANAAASSFIDISLEHNGDWVSVFTCYDITDNPFYISEKYRNKKIKITVIPLNDDDAIIGKPYECITDVIKDEFEFDLTSLTTSWDDDTENIAYSLVCKSNSVDGNFVAMLCQFTPDNEMLPMKVVPFEVKAGEEPKSIEGISDNIYADATKAYLFIWEGTSSIDTNMVPVIGADIIEKE